jgi:hypothetical protein
VQLLLAGLLAGVGTCVSDWVEGFRTFFGRLGLIHRRCFIGSIGTYYKPYQYRNNEMNCDGIFRKMSIRSDMMLLFWFEFSWKIFVGPLLAEAEARQAQKVLERAFGCETA